MGSLRTCHSWGMYSNTRGDPKLTERTLDARDESACTPRTDTDAFRIVSSIGRPLGFSCPPPSASGPPTVALRERPYHGSPSGDRNNTAPRSSLGAGSLPLLRLQYLYLWRFLFPFSYWVWVIFPSMPSKFDILEGVLPQGTATPWG
ncbi:hypothetical protein BDV32DRAFT_132325 [Aspergillus pseudonomiae]|nr:hypothetical protein BDV32DRAFT_132325 [Aspergillus pseudonomiae]